MVLITGSDWFLLALWSVREATKHESVSVAQSDSFEKNVTRSGLSKEKGKAGFSFYGNCGVASVGI